MTAPRNERPQARRRVGARHNGGELSGAVTDDGRAVWVNAYMGTGITVTVSPNEAEGFGLWLIACARTARTNRDRL